MEGLNVPGVVISQHVTASKMLQYTENIYVKAFLTTPLDFAKKCETGRNPHGSKS